MIQFIAVSLLALNVWAADDCESQFQSTVEEMQKAFAENQSRLVRGEISETQFHRVRGELLIKKKKIEAEAGVKISELPHLKKVSKKSKPPKKKVLTPDRFVQRTLPEFTGFTKTVYDRSDFITLTRDEKYILANYNGVLHAINLEKSQDPEAYFSLDMPAAKAIAFNPVNSGFVAISDEGTMISVSEMSTKTGLIPLYRDYESNGELDLAKAVDMSGMLYENAVQYSPNGKYILARFGDDGVCIWETGKNEVLLKIENAYQATWFDSESVIIRNANYFALNSLVSDDTDVIFDILELENEFNDDDLSLSRLEMVVDAKRENLWIFHTGYAEGVRWNFEGKKFDDHISAGFNRSDEEYHHIIMDLTGKYVGFSQSGSYDDPAQNDESSKMSVFFNLESGLPFEALEISDFDKSDINDFIIGSRFNWNATQLNSRYDDAFKILEIKSGMSEVIE